MNLTTIFFERVLENNTQIVIQFFLYGVGTFFATTLMRVEKSKDSVLDSLQIRLNHEISRLKSILENKNKQLLEAGQIIKKQEDILTKYGLNKENHQGTRIDIFEKLINSILLTENNWVDFQETFETLYPRFFTNLKLKQPDLTEGEKRLAVLIKLKLKNKEMARMLGISPNSIVKSRYRLKKKICKYFPGKSLEELILGI